MSARAIATRCFCPPDNWFGLKFTRSPKPTLVNASIAAFSRSGFGTPAYTSGKATFSIAVSPGKSSNV